jgi:hypothetical protein
VVGLHRELVLSLRIELHACDLGRVRRLCQIHVAKAFSVVIGINYREGAEVVVADLHERLRGVTDFGV